MHDMANDELLTSVSQQIFARMIAENRDHLLVRIGVRFNLDDMVERCRTYRLYDGGRGVEADYSLHQLVGCVLVKRLFNWSGRKTAQRLATDMAVRWFAGFSLHERTPDHTTIHRFESWISTHEPRALFSLILQQIDEDFPEEKTAIQFGDTFAMRTRAAGPTRTDLLRDTAQRLWNSFTSATQGPNQVTALLPLFQAVMGADDERPAFSLSPHERDRLTLDTAGAALLLLAAVDACANSLTRPFHPAYAAMQNWMARLQKILTDEYVVQWDESGAVQSIRFCTDKERGSYRIISAVDPDATLRIHGNSVDRGYNVSVAATANFVREIAAATGSTPDSVGIAPLIRAQLEHLHVVPPKLVYDQAGGTPKTIADVLVAGQGRTQLVVHMVDYNPNRTRFGPQDFSLTENGLTCPYGQTATRFYRSGSGEGWNYRFLPQQCAACPLHRLCRNPQAKTDGYRQVYISDHILKGRNAIAYAKTDDFQAEMKLRSNIERIIAALVRFNGARHAESYGLDSADYQARMAAMAYNLKRWAVLIRQRERLERRIASAVSTPA